MPLHKIDYFCAKLQKNVDSDLVSTLIAIGVGVLVFVAEKLSSKKKNGTEPTKASTRVGAVSRRVAQPDPAAEARRQARARRRQVVQEPAASVRTAACAMPEAALPEEGVRVTTGGPAAGEETATTKNNVPTLPGGDLRTAIIWSEILKTKF